MIYYEQTYGGHYAFSDSPLVLCGFEEYEILRGGKAMSTLQEEISRRRTFAIISHPDAGKTTLTEKFLLYGGAIAQAGVVKGKKNSRAATSDWM